MCPIQSSLCFLETWAGAWYNVREHGESSDAKRYLIPVREP